MSPNREGARQVHYSTRVLWTGMRDAGTRTYRSYDRTWDLTTPNKAVIHCSNDPLLGGDSEKHNPEDLLLSSVAACHMLWFLHLASDAKVVVLGYEDSPVGTGELMPSGAGRFLEILLRPRILLAHGADATAADALHERVHGMCFIARSLACPVICEATYRLEDGPLG